MKTSANAYHFLNAFRFDESVFTTQIKMSSVRFEQMVRTDKAKKSQILEKIAVSLNFMLCCGVAAALAHEFHLTVILRAQFRCTADYLCRNKQTVLYDVVKCVDCTDPLTRAHAHSQCTLVTGHSSLSLFVVSSSSRSFAITLGHAGLSS